MAIDPALLRFEETVPAAASWSHVLKRGTALRLTDLEGGANVSALFYNFELLSERLNLPDTLKCQHTARLTAGHCLYSDMGRILVSLIADTCGWHDPLAGTSNSRLISRRYGVLTYQNARNGFHRDAHGSFLRELGKHGLGERDLAMNVNFFQKVTADEGGRLHYHAGHSPRGSHVDLRAEMNTLVVLNTCMHPLDTSPVYAPKPVHAAIWTAAPPGANDLCRNSCDENRRGFTITERYFL